MDADRCALFDRLVGGAGAPLLCTYGRNPLHLLVDPLRQLDQRVERASLNEALGWERNHYDRLVHLLWGLCLTQPIYETLQQRLMASDRAGPTSPCTWCCLHPHYMSFSSGARLWCLGMAVLPMSARRAMSGMPWPTLESVLWVGLSSCWCVMGCGCAPLGQYRDGSPRHGGEWPSAGDLHLLSRRAL